MMGNGNKYHGNNFSTGPPYIQRLLSKSGHFAVYVSGTMVQYEMTSDFSYLLIGGAVGCLVCVLIFRVISPLLSGLLTSTYNTLSSDQQAEWNDRVLSNVHAAICMVTTVSCLVFDEAVSADPIWYNSKLTRISVSCTIGYMFGDLFCLLLWCNIDRSDLLAFTAHHVATAYAYYFVSVYGILCYFAMFRMLAEFSNFCMNQRWYFDIMGKPRTNRIVVLNGVGLFVTFFLCRIVTMPTFWYKIWSVFNTEAALPLGHIQYTVMLFPSMVLDSLNVLWFYKIGKGLMRVILNMRAEEKQHSQ